MRPLPVGRLAIAAIGTLAILALVVTLSALRLPYHDPNVARIRLSWTARPERIETCRKLSREELEKLEVHMRQRVECEGRFATYDLKVSLDGRPVHESVVRGAGLRHDRPLYLLRDIEVPAGEHHLAVTFERREKTDDDAAAFQQGNDDDDEHGTFAGRARREVDERARRALAAIPARVSIDTNIPMETGSVTLVTLGADRRSLVLVGKSSASAVKAEENHH